jgi:hypothetical protein
MTLWDSYGAPQYDLDDVKVAAYTATDTYGAAVDVPSVQLYGVTMRVRSAEGEGDGKITVTASRVIGGKARIRFLGIDFEVLEVLIGLTANESGSTPNRGNLLEIPAGHKLPHFGICGRSFAEEGTGDFHIFIPKARIMSDVELAVLQLGQFATPEFEIGFVDDDTYEAFQFIEHETATAVVIPPVQ